MVIRIFTLLLLLAPGIAAEDYRFTLEGEVVHPTIYPVAGERYGRPAKGDFAILGDWRFVVPEPGHYRLRREGQRPVRIWAAKEGTSEGLVGLVEPNTGAEGPADSLLVSLTEDAKAELWGISLINAREVHPQHLLHLSPDCAIHIAVAPRPDDKPFPLPLLPVGTTALSLAAPEGTHFSNKNHVRTCPALRYLELELAKDDEAHRFLPHTKGVVPKLENYSLRGGTLAQLPALDSLRFLKIRDCRITIPDGFFPRFPLLKVLKLDGSNLADLRFLASPDSGLRLLSAHDTPLEHLPPPSGLPSIRDLRIANTPLLQNRELVAKYRAVASVSVKNWEPSIRAFEKWDAENELPEKPVLFVGSSSIRLWKLKKAFPDVTTLNRGFGGSELSDSLQYFDRIVLPYRPRAILLYAGDNDVGRDESAEQVIADFQAFAAKVRSKLPKAHFAFLPIKPSPARWDLWPEMQKANAAIREITGSHPRLHYLDTVTPMLGEDGTPREEFFLGDGLHMNKAGYDAWNAVVGPWLESIE